MMVAFVILEMYPMSVGGGADFVMVGSMLARDECPSEIIEEEDGKKYKLFYGMSSDTVNEYIMEE